MNTLFEKLRPAITGVIRHAWAVVLVAALLTGVGIWSASRLSIQTDLARLLPDDYPSVQALDRLREMVGGESEATVAIKSPSFAANLAFAEALVPQALALTDEQRGEPLLLRAELRRETSFLENNALYFASEAELDELETYLNDLAEEARLRANPFYVDLDEEWEEEGGEEGVDSPEARFQETWNRIVGTEYAVSADSTVLLVRFYPAGSSTNIGFIQELYTQLDRLLETMQPASYHPDLQVISTGRLYRQMEEVNSIRRDVAGSFGAGVGSVLLVVMFYFLWKSYTARARKRRDGKAFAKALVRAPMNALVIGLPLLMSLTWTFGLAGVIFGELNLMTSTLGLVLYGLGIDYGVHFFARYTEQRGRGDSIEEAAVTTFLQTGQAITVGALTTALALLVLSFADFQGFAQFGVLSFMGVMLALIAMTFVLPALVVLFEKMKLLNFEGEEQVEHKGIRTKFPAARPVLVGSVIAMVLAIVFLPRVKFEYNFNTLEPTYEAFEARNQWVTEVQPGANTRRNPAYIIAESPEHAREIQNILEERKNSNPETLILAVESLQQRFPQTEEQQQARLERLAEIRRLTEDPLLNIEPNADLERLKRAASTVEAIAEEQIPQSLRSQFMTRDGELGQFVMVYANQSLGDGKVSMAFSEEIGTVTLRDGTVYHAGSTSLVAADMLDLMLSEAPWMVIASLLIVVLLMGVNFRKVRLVVLATLPLIVGLLWMLLVLEILNLRLNFYNLVILPALLGIGNDAGVHMVHRYLEEGKGSIMHVIRTTGEHIFVCSITTMIGFGGLLLSFHPGLRSMGEVAVIGIAATLAAALLFLPALLQTTEK